MWHLPRGGLLSTLLTELASSGSFYPWSAATSSLFRKGQGSGLLAMAKFTSSWCLITIFENLHSAGSPQKMLF